MDAQALLGHESYVLTAQIYAHLFPEAMRDTAHATAAAFPRAGQSGRDCRTPVVDLVTEVYRLACIGVRTPVPGGTDVQLYVKLYELEYLLEQHPQKGGRMSETPPEHVEILNSYTPPGLYQFLELAIKRGNLTNATGTALRVGSKKVLDIEENDDVDLRQIDLDDLLDRFKRLTRADLSEKSQETYEARVRKAIAMYIKFADGDASWKTIAAGKNASKPKKASTPKTNGTTPPVEGQLPFAPTQPPTSPLGKTVTVPVPLRRDGTQATVILPVDVTEREVKKVAQIIELYAMTEQLAITSGDDTE